EVVDNSRIFAMAWLPALSAHRVKVGQPARVRIGFAKLKPDQKPSPESIVQKGTVVFVGKAADPQTGNVPIRVEIENPGLQIVIGETLEVVVAVSESKTQIAVPSAAINDIGEGPLLSVVRDGKIVVFHPEVGTAFEGWVPVSAKGLNEHDAVVVEGGYN